MRLDWRGRIGFVVAIPVIGTVAWELNRLAPEGVVFTFTTLGKRDQSPGETEKALERIEEVTSYMARTGVDYIILASVPMAAYRGPGGNRDLIERVEKATNVPATTTLTAGMEAMRALSMKRIVMSSPYQHQNAPILKVLEAEGFSVLGTEGLDTPLLEIGRASTETSYRLAKQTFLQSPDADGIYMPGAELPASMNVHSLEQDLGVPVVAAVQASLWMAMKTLHIREKITGYGRLLEEIL